MIFGGFLFTIFQTHALNEMMLETKLRVYLGWYLLLDSLLSYIVMLIYAALVLLSF